MIFNDGVTSGSVPLSQSSQSPAHFQPPSGAGAVVVAQSVPGWWPGQTAASVQSQTSLLWSWSSLDTSTGALQQNGSRIPAVQ